MEEGAREGGLFSSPKEGPPPPPFLFPSFLTSEGRKFKEIGRLRRRRRRRRPEGPVIVSLPLFLPSFLPWCIWREGRMGGKGEEKGSPARTSLLQTRREGGSGRTGRVGDSTLNNRCAVKELIL